MLSAGLTTIGASPTHAIHSVSSTRCGFSFAPIGRASVRPGRRQICSAPMVGRSKPRPYSAHFQHNTSQKTPLGRRVAPRCDLFCAPYHSPLISLDHSRICDTAAVASCEGRGTWDERMGGVHHRVGDTMMMQSVGDASIVVNPTLSIGDA